MARVKRKMDGEGCSHKRTISWGDERTKFILDWYIEHKKDRDASFAWKRQHHMKCADTLNKEFVMVVTFVQVKRHYRYYKENWDIVETALWKSGNGFDTTRCKLIISESEKAKLNDRARRLLCKPIKFFSEMQELFSGCYTYGSFAMDQHTCLDDGSKSDSNSEGMNGMPCYGQLIDLHDHDDDDDDSDTLPSPKVHQATPSAATSADNGSSSTSRTIMKRKRGVKSPPKKLPKPKSRRTDADDEIITTLKATVQALAHGPQFVDSHAALWQRLEALPIPSEDKISVREHLTSAENEGMRGFLAAASDRTWETWVFQILCKKYCY